MADERYDAVMRSLQWALPAHFFRQSRDLEAWRADARSFGATSEQIDAAVARGVEIGRTTVWSPREAIQREFSELKRRLLTGAAIDG